jgi:hypothetical protein
MHPVTINVPDKTYKAAKEIAESRGYISVEDYVSDWLEKDAAFEIAITPDVSSALEEGLADITIGNTMSLDEHKKRHTERRNAWMQSNSQ